MPSLIALAWCCCSLRERDELKYRYFTGGYPVKDERRFGASYERHVCEDFCVEPRNSLEAGGAYVAHPARIRVVSNAACLHTTVAEAPNNLTGDPYRPMITVIIRTDLRIDENVPRCAQGAVGIIGFALPTMFTCVHADLARNRTLHPYRKGHFLGSRQGHVVLAEAGLDGKSQYVAIREYTAARTQR